jgi:imidazole glycerol-phosphate synthase subunit HisH
MRIVIIDYNSGNLHSAAAAFRRVAGDDCVTVSSDAKSLQHATHIVLPGVGAYADCMAGLQAVEGMVDALHTRVKRAGVPFLGICVGMQMMLERGFEHGQHQGLGWIKGDVVAIEPKDKGLKIPHMGWNELKPKHDVALFDGLELGAHAYFVHSYHAQCADESDVLATVEYGGDVVAAIGRDNMIGTQFHPEKSQRTGEIVMRNFLAMA